MGVVSLTGMAVPGPSMQLLACRHGSPCGKVYVMWTEGNRCQSGPQAPVSSTAVLYISKINLRSPYIANRFC